MIDSHELKQRDNYLNKLIGFQDTEPIKVITGIRRCGKSSLLKLMIRHLRETGVSQEQIVEMNFESHDFRNMTSDAVYHYVKDRVVSGKRMYLFFDELQRIDAWEDAVNSFRVDLDCDIYVTGSNAYLLSSEYSTYLSGRCVEIKMLPLSFYEFLEITGSGQEQGLSEYMRDGGLPYVAVMDRTPEKVDTYLEGIYNTVIVKDIEDRQARKESDSDKRKINDILLLKTIARYLASIVGNPVSIRSITDYFISNGRKISPNTVSDYVEALTESFIFYPAERFDIIGKQLLKANRKMYIVDLGLRNHILPRRQYDLGFSLENIVYFELLRRGYRVMIGKVGSTLFVPMLAINYTSVEDIVPFKVVATSGDLIRISAIVGGMLLICIAVLSVMVIRQKIDRAVKLGEE